MLRCLKIVAIRSEKKRNGQKRTDEMLTITTVCKSSWAVFVHCWWRWRCCLWYTVRIVYSSSVRHSLFQKEVFFVLNMRSFFSVLRFLSRLSSNLIICVASVCASVSYFRCNSGIGTLKIHCLLPLEYTCV